ncbi:MAG TPA: nuclear transport factor 2 family protein [Candidatus Polarisedimenticolia bacterium]|nr:nuclear transport factor 2 family protein [Candidatus Polarisedimenticolia bacterium]
MKSLSLAIASLVVLGSIPVATPEASPPGAPERPGAAAVRPGEEEVWRVVEEFNRAFAANDSDRYFRFIDDRITVLTPSNPYRVEGIVDDWAEFELGLRLGYGRIGYFQELQPRVDLYGDVAVATYFSRGRYGPDVKAATLYLKETDVLVRTSGQWKIVHIHVSATTPQ